ncbi:MAG: YidC/Oxa1 family membrane protein insertase [Patescibacteria group bacterium]|mgnify:CR=1 FL=1
MTWLYNEILYRPLFNVLVWISQLLPGNDFGLAIIALTLIIRGLLLPLSLATARSQRVMQKLNPRIQELREKFKQDQAGQSAAMMALYRQEKVNPLSGCLPLLIQLPVIIALYQAFLAGFKPENLNLLYSFVPRPEFINTLSFGIITITAQSPLLAVGAGIAQFLQAKITMTAQTTSPQPEMAAALNAQMVYIFPIMVVVIGWNLPAGLTLYWIATALFSIGEQLYLRKAVR